MNHFLSYKKKEEEKQVVKLELSLNKKEQSATATIDKEVYYSIYNCY